MSTAWLYAASTAQSHKPDAVTARSSIADLFPGLSATHKRGQNSFSGSLTSVSGGRTRLLLALGGVDAAITLLVAPLGGGDFVRRCRLTGHLDWVRSLAFAHTSPADTSAAGTARGKKRENGKAGEETVERWLRLGLQQ